MNIELEDNKSCLECDKRFVCQFFKRIRDSYNSMLSEIGNWKDRSESVRIILAVTAVNCNEFREPEVEE